MDAKSILRKVLDKYSGKNKKILEHLWNRAETDGTLEQALHSLLENNAEGLSVNDALERWRLFSESENEKYMQDFFSGVDEHEAFNEGIRQEVDSLDDEERASLENDNSDLGEDSMINDNRLFFPSMDPRTKDHDQELKSLKFQEVTERKRVIEAAERQRKRDYELEMKLIREQGPLDRTGLSKNYLEKWKEENPEYMEKLQAEWDAQDQTHDASHNRKTLWDRS